MEELKGYNRLVLNEIICISKIIHKQAKFQLAICNKIFPENLKGACGLLSVTLFNKLNHKYDLAVVYGKYKKHNHCWVEFDSSIIDLTATQFRMNKEVFLSKKDCNYSKLHIVNNLSFFNNWNKYSQPSSYNVTWRDNMPIFKYKY